MQALEMEEVESLVGAGNRKKLAVKRSQSKDGFMQVAVKKDFISKVVLMAGIALVALLYVSTVDNGGGDTKPAPVEDKVPYASPVALVATTPAPIAVATTTPPVIVTPTNPPVAQTPPPVASSMGSSATADTSNSNNLDGNNLYSKFATISPLINHPLPDAATKQAMAEKYGHWHFWDGDEEGRPSEDYAAKYPYRDIPGDDFPDDAWQADAVFVNHYLNDADQLISRAMEAIFTEYGHGKPLPPEGMAARMKQFHWEKVDMKTATGPPAKYSRRGDRGNGGWTTERSFDGLVRRLLHAMMSTDTFTVVMGGHSAAAAQGNHFRQSYMMQFHKIMEPIFARLGVKLITRNMGQGGLGTIQAGMGSGSIYGDEVDLLLWDSGMTEGVNVDHIDLFLRQALLAGNRVPVIWGGNFELLKMLHEYADVDVGEWGLATDGILEVESAKQAKDIPWAGRYMKCKEEAAALCQEEPRFCSNCWIDRDDGIKPEKPQLAHPKGQVRWHPGWRSHQLTGRNLAFSMLQGLQAAINIWNENVMGGPPLEDDFWHIGEYYENIRSKVKNLDQSLGNCHKVKGLPTRMCNTAMKARTQYTPRANPEKTSLISIIKPTADGYVPKNDKKALYDGPDVPNPCLAIPEGEVDVFSVVTGRRRVAETNDLRVSPVDIPSPEFPIQAATNRSLEGGILPGKGWELWGEPQGYCDGTYNAVCGIHTDSDCVLYGHHDERGAIIGNEYSGWLVMNLEDLKEGIIVIKLHTWQIDSESIVTVGWNSVNNERGRRLGKDSRQELLETTKETDPSRKHVEVDESGERQLMRSYDTPELPDTFKFEYAINGKVTTLTKDQFLEQKKQIQRVVETLTLLDDPNFTTEAKNVEFAIRLVGCGRQCTFGLSHVYWA